MKIPFARAYGRLCKRETIYTKSETFTTENTQLYRKAVDRIKNKTLVQHSYSYAVNI